VEKVIVCAVMWLIQLKYPAVIFVEILLLGLNFCEVLVLYIKD